MIKTGAALALAAMRTAQQHKTIYALGSFGWPMTATNKVRALKVPGNGKRADKFNAANSGTQAAVRSYQADKGLAVDGIVGKATWGKLLGV